MSRKFFKKFKFGLFGFIFACIAFGLFYFIPYKNDILSLSPSETFLGYTGVFFWFTGLILCIIGLSRKRKMFAVFGIVFLLIQIIILYTGWHSKLVALFPALL